MSKKKILFITIEPVDYYFFGGENTFGQLNKERQPYQVDSRKIPQQTSIVGLLRHILINNGIDIGPESFDIRGDQKKTQSFGALHSISQLYMVRKNQKGLCELFLPAGNLYLSDKTKIQYEFEENSDKKKYPRLFYETKNDAGKVIQTDYSEKNKFNDYWVNLSNPSELISEDCQNPKDTNFLFKSSYHVGINKMDRIYAKQNASNQGSPVQEGFFKQEFYRLKKNFQFGVFVTLDEEVDINIFNTVMQFGGERRSFFVNAELGNTLLTKTKEQIQQFFSHPNRIILTSDAFLEKPAKVFDKCNLVIGNFIPFRNIIVAQKEKSDFRNLQTNKLPGKFRLLKRGSVLYPNSEQSKNEILQCFNQMDNCRAIGYNQTSILS